MKKLSIAMIFGQHKGDYLTTVHTIENFGHEQVKNSPDRHREKTIWREKAKHCNDRPERTDMGKATAKLIGNTVFPKGKLCCRLIIKQS